MTTKLAALMVLVAFLAGGPAACEGISICFNGWLRLPTWNSQLCRSRPDVQTRQRIPPPSGAGLSYDDLPSAKRR